MQCTNIRRAWLFAALLLMAAMVPATFAATTPEVADNAFGSPVADTELAHNRGGHAISINRTITINAQRLEAQMTGNNATNNLTGANLISGGAFAGSGGLSTVIQNTGNNVIIQNATILNVQVR